MSLHHVTRDGQTQPGTAGLAGASLVDTVKALEDAGEMFGRDAGAKVADADPDGSDSRAMGAVRVGHLSCADQNSAVGLVAGLTVLNAILDEIAQDLEDSVGVGHHLRGCGLANFEDSRG